MSGPALAQRGASQYARHSSCTRELAKLALRPRARLIPMGGRQHSYTDRPKLSWLLYSTELTYSGKMTSVPFSSSRFFLHTRKSAILDFQGGKSLPRPKNNRVPPFRRSTRRPQSRRCGAPVKQPSRGQRAQKQSTITGLASALHTNKCYVPRAVDRLWRARASISFSFLSRAGFRPRLMTWNPHVHFADLAEHFNSALRSSLLMSSKTSSRINLLRSASVSLRTLCSVCLRSFDVSSRREPKRATPRALLIEQRVCN